ncbi:uncharacterized protein PHACADRAFT_205649 [Phanerochaete carnosa HHB-10118-sp]|uniref:DNA-directed DNA polymerase n=1 Tax=Phanerochaete carnosa (strain HHB-10118-sp) TaxID=650164 RepID=K5WJX8_PHACS|nr:uncharacterized protein PHACADRAFT_205649 [Phanerochaete carnosa HHB-10118-sp]EKM59439.1 hypothetical protein PHACADRAFT_205649 [Phanerochaete carnosa HHB-10118-sp]
MLAKISNLSGSSRLLHTSRTNLVQQQKLLPASVSSKRTPTAAKKQVEGQIQSERVAQSRKSEESRHAKRNEVGVQLLSKRLHQQIFRNVSFPPPNEAFVRIAREHLKMHGLDPSQGSVLPDIGFTLPTLQGRTLDEHFYRIGSVAAQPWLALAQDLASLQLPPKPDEWLVESGWTKYVHRSDGSSYHEHVPYPEHDNGKPEQMLVFDVETMPEYSPYAIMACAASKNAWYAWISPWLLGETSDPKHLIPLGSPSLPRVVVGHNVSYDRARILEEYSTDGTQNRFLDTMALHVAVKGISSHQRPAWMKYRKNKEKEIAQKEEAVDAVLKLLEETEQQQREEQDTARKEELRRLKQEMEETLPQLMTSEEGEAELSSKRWEDITSANSLADVAKLHCNIEVDKTIRDDFGSRTREDILDGIQDYLHYCSSDVFVTHAVYCKVLPAFLTSCPSPVSFAGILTMGSALLTVNQEWERYIEEAERTYRELEDKVKSRLVELAYQAKDLVDSEKWKEDVWLNQLDWTPKIAGKSRGIGVPTGQDSSSQEPKQQSSKISSRAVPAWYAQLLSLGPREPSIVNRILPCLLKLSLDGHPLVYGVKYGWHCLVNGEATRLPTARAKVVSVLGPTHGLRLLKDKRLSSCNDDLALALCSRSKDAAAVDRIVSLAEATSKLDPEVAKKDLWLMNLDWTPSKAPVATANTAPIKAPKKSPTPKALAVHWPKWYWDLARPKKDCSPGTLDVTVRNRIAPILLRLSWQGWPLFHSREHGWTFRVDPGASFQTRAAPLSFYDAADDMLQESVLRDGYTFYKLPHKDGEKANVGSPLSKTFMKYAQDGILTSPGDEAKDALDLNAQCSYWISARDRVLKQMVVWQDDEHKMGFTPGPNEKWGIIIPQVITMGTVTRRAIEKTWLTASNAKKNRVGSELKAMVRAPEGYAIVGADVDSEELWISSVMGDAQFGLHGATAIGWMTLEGTKAAGTDLHSKTASILGISRDQAKVFNYSRIYGAGMRHAVLLLLQANPSMLPEEAQKLAENLYASTKGKNTHRADIFGRKFWFGGTESFVFNKLEEIALSDKPQTPALGCGITYALSKEYLPAEFGSDYMTSRINWVVQSSGVDYLHLLIVSMEYLMKKYDIKARYLISVHDELRYLVKEEDKYRAALALQIANLWTRCLFALRLGLDDLPQGVGFFSAVDIDKVLRKEVDMPCVTPSHPVPIAPGESLDVVQVLDKTHGGSLNPDGSPMVEEPSPYGVPQGYNKPNYLAHRANNAAWLRAQTTSEFAEIKILAHKATGKKYQGGVGGGSRPRGKADKKVARKPLDPQQLLKMKQGKLDLAEAAAAVADWHSS